MPINRTPPPVQPPSENQSPGLSMFASPLQHYPSESNVSEVGLEAGLSAASSASSLAKSISSASYITTRSNNNAKRKRADEAVNEDITKSEMMEMFMTIQRQQDLKLDVVLSSIRDVKLSVESLTSKYEEVLQKINSLEYERNADKSYISQLEHRLDMMEHKVRSTCIEIKNIPQGNRETKEDIKKIVFTIANLFEIPVQNCEIKDVYRVKTRSGNHPIIADFTSTLLRDRFLSSFKKYNKQHQQNKLNTSNINAGDQGNPVYISENFSQKERKLFYQARDFAKHNGYTFCWTSFGRIFLRKEEGSPQIRISSESDLARLEAD